MVYDVEGSFRSLEARDNLECPGVLRFRDLQLERSSGGGQVQVDNG